MQLETSFLAWKSVSVKQHPGIRLQPIGLRQMREMPQMVVGGGGAPLLQFSPVHRPNLFRGHKRFPSFPIPSSERTSTQ